MKNQFKSEIKVFKKKFEFTEALELIVDSIDNVYNDSFHYNEIIRLLILLGDENKLIKIIEGYLTHPAQNISIDEDIFFRLTCSFPKIDKNKYAHPIKTKSYSWINEVKNNKVDNPSNPAIKRFTITFKNFSIFHLTCKCNSCDEEYFQIIKGTIAINKNYFCPFCLSKQVITSLQLQNEIQENFRDFLIETDEVNNGEIDLKLAELIKSVNQIQEGKIKIPLLFQYLNQDALFLFNQVILENYQRKN